MWLPSFPTLLYYYASFLRCIRERPRDHCLIKVLYLPQNGSVVVEDRHMWKECGNSSRGYRLAQECESILMLTRCYPIDRSWEEDMGTNKNKASWCGRYSQFELNPTTSLLDGCRSVCKCVDRYLSGVRALDELKNELIYLDFCFSRSVNIEATIDERLCFGDHPQSRRALVSSRASGQLSAIACL